MAIPVEPSGSIPLYAVEPVKSSFTDVVDPLVVSIVVINHNYRPYLQQAISSALHQTYASIEVIVVDDGSTDGSQDIVRKYSDAVVPVLQSRGGHVAAFNAGFSKARGDIIIFLDADDLLYPMCVLQIVEAWEPGLAKIQYRLDTIDRDSVNQRMPFPYFPPDLDPKAVLDQAIEFGVYPWTVSSGNAFSRSYLQKLVPIETSRIWKSPDGYVNKMAPLYGAVKSIDKTLGAYRVHGRNAWAQSGERIDTAAISRWVAFDSLLHEEFVTRAKAGGYCVKPYDSILNPQAIEYRLLSLRLAPGQHPFKEDTRLRLAIRGFRSALNAPNVSFVGRMIWRLWFLIISGAPLAIVTVLLRSGRGQSKRGLMARLLVRVSRGTARAG